jgi:hypothetical protein
LVKPDLVQQFGKVGEWMRKLNITVPFMEAITQMPAYAKCLKEIMSKNKGLKEIETVILNNLSSKLKDPGSFTIPCFLGNIKFKNALCDLRASVRLPTGILEGIPIQVGKFFIPIHFVICDMKEDPYIPIILGRPHSWCKN